MSIIAKAIEYLNKETGNNYICEIIYSPNNELEYNNQVKFFLEEPNNNELVLINQKPYSWLQIQSKLNKAEFDIKLQFLRIERNKLLSQTDWHITKAKENNEEIPANIKKTCGTRFNKSMFIIYHIIYQDNLMNTINLAICY